MAGLVPAIHFFASKTLLNVNAGLTQCLLLIEADMSAPLRDVRKVPIGDIDLVDCGAAMARF
jgi:hypothetical protein